MSALLLVLGACTWAPLQALGDAEHQDLFAIEAHGHTMAGTALVAVRGESVTLHGLAPTGNDLFQVEVVPGQAVVETPDADLGDWLRRIPFERDLSMLYRWRCEAERCRGDGWRVTRRGDGWKIRGPGGPASLARAEGRWRLEDPVRGYTLTVVPGEAP